MIGAPCLSEVCNLESIVYILHQQLVVLCVELRWGVPRLCFASLRAMDRHRMIMLLEDPT